MSWLEASVRWYAVLIVLTWGWAPLVAMLCPRLADRGATITRPLALLGVVYPLWLLASLNLVPYSTVGLWVTLAVGTSIGWGWVLWRQSFDRKWLHSLVVGECLALVSFAAYVWLRGFRPELVGTEKPMDAAFLSSSALTTTIPPPDPWFAGEPINYYYLGYLLHGSVARLADIPSTTGFNLALATTFSMAFTAAAGVGFNAARPWLARRRAFVAGALASVFLVVIGNLYAPIRLLQTPRQTFDAWWWDTAFGVGWRASRIVCDGARVAGDCSSGAVETINEFPIFSFLLGDLHPHLMALPFTVVALGLALSMSLRDDQRRSPRGRHHFVRITATGGIIGSLYAMNSWDYPTYLVLAVIALLFAHHRYGKTGALPAVIALVASSVLAWLPFFARFVPPTGSDRSGLPAVVRDLPVLPSLLTSIVPYGGERTSLAEFLTVFGIPYLLGLWLVLTGIGLPRRQAGEDAVSRTTLFVGLASVASAILLQMPVLVLAGIPLVIAIGNLQRSSTLSGRTVATALYAAGLALIIVVEFFYIRDAFNSRMNTLFKVYYQVWTLWAIAASLGCVVLWQEARPRLLARPALFSFLTVALIAGLSYPVLASYRWTVEFDDWQGVDGMAYVERDRPDELAALRWLQENGKPDDVLLEAAGCSYEPNGQLPFNRGSAYSGVPSVIGWGNNHQPQWRSGQPELIASIHQREQDVARLYGDPRSDLLDKYGVTLLFVGGYEREDWQQICPGAGPFPAVGEATYPGPGWDLAFRSSDVQIYRRQQES